MRIKKKMKNENQKKTDLLKVHIWCNWGFSQQCPKDLCTVILCGEGNKNAFVQPPRTEHGYSRREKEVLRKKERKKKKRRKRKGKEKKTSINDIRSIGSANDKNTPPSLQPIHFGQQLIHNPFSCLGSFGRRVRK